MKNNRTLKLTVYIVLVALVGFIYCYHTGNRTMQGMWSGALLTAFITHGFLLKDKEEMED